MPEPRMESGGEEKAMSEDGKRYSTIQIWVEDKSELDKVHKVSGKPRVLLMKEAVELLKKRYNVKN